MRFLRCEASVAKERSFCRANIVMLMLCMLCGDASAQGASSAAIDFDTLPGGSASGPLIVAYAPSGPPILAGERSQTDRVARVWNTNLPRPAIAIGEMNDVVRAAFDLPVLSGSYTWNILAEREASRLRDPVAFRRAVEGGEVDPPSARARTEWMQEQLGRLECYGSPTSGGGWNPGGVDNSWGFNSRIGMRSYLRTVGQEQAYESEATLNLYRLYTITGDADCARETTASVRREEEAARTPVNTSSGSTNTSTTRTTTVVSPTTTQGNATVTNRSEPAGNDRMQRVLDGLIGGNN